MVLNGVVKQPDDEYDINTVHISEVVSMYRLCQLMIIKCNDSAVLKIIMDMYNVKVCHPRCVVNTA
jgi:hypothetical protein